MNDTAIEPAQELNPLLSIGRTSILDGHDRMIEDCIAACEVEPMLSQVRLSFGLVPDDHRFYCSYIKMRIKAGKDWPIW